MFDESGWVNKIITAGIIAMIGWTLMSVQRMSVDLAVLTTQVRNITSQLEKQPSIVDIITLQQKAERHDLEISRILERLNNLENRSATRETPNR